MNKIFIMTLLCFAHYALNAAVIPVPGGTQGKKDARIAEDLLNHPKDPLNVQKCNANVKKSAFVYKGKSGHIIITAPRSHTPNTIPPGHAFIFESPTITSTLTYSKNHPTVPQEYTISPNTTVIYVCDDRENITIWQFEGKIAKHSQRLMPTYAGGKKVKVSCCW